LDVTGNTDIDGTLDVDGDTEMDTVNVAGSLTVADNADLNSDLDVDGNTTLDSTVINESFAFNGGGFSVEASQIAQMSMSYGERSIAASEFSMAARMDGVGDIVMSPADTSFWGAGTFGDLDVDSTLASFASFGFAGTMTAYEDASSTYEWGVAADSVHVWTNRMDLNGNLRVEGDSDLEGALDVDGDTDLDDTDVDGTLDVSGNTDIDGTLDVQEATNMQSSLTVAGATDLNSTLDVDGDTEMDTVNIAGSLTVADDTDLNAELDVDGDTHLDTTDIDGSLDVQDATNMQSTLTVADDTDLNAELDVDGDTHLDTTDIDGSLDVQDMATFQANVQINDSLNVTNDAHIGGNFQVDGNSDLDGTLDVEGATNMQSTLTVAGATDLNSTLDVDGDTELDTTNIDGSLTVRDFADFNDSLDVEMSVNIQDNLDVNDSLDLNTANNEGRILTVYDSQGGLGVSIETVNTSGSTSATTLTTHRLVVQDDAVYNGDMNVNGALAVTSNITSAAAPTSPNHMTNKQYVDDAIAAAITPPAIWDYDVTSSTSGDTVYYINGDLLLYATEEDGQENYTIRLYGRNLNEGGDMDVTNVHLRARGNMLGTNNATNDLTIFTGGNGATFDIGYTDIKALAGGQEDGYVSTHLTFTTDAGTIYNTGVTIRFYLDSANAAADGATFTDPE
jgi:hypothetical protein